MTPAGSAPTPGQMGIAVDALRLLARDTCGRFTSGPGSCWRSYERGARYGGEAWCEQCVALDALRRIEEGGGEPPRPSWQEILTAERDEARRELERLQSAYYHVEGAWTQMQNAARQVIRNDLPAEGVTRV